MVQPIFIDITIVSNNTELEKRIQTIVGKDNNTVNIKTCEMSQVRYTDILICDDTASSIGGIKGKGILECVLYASPEQVQPILLSHAEWTGIWAHPVSDFMLEFYVRQLLLSVQLKKELATTKTYLDTLIDSVPDLVWFKDLKGSHLKVNDAFCRAVGKTKEQCEGRGHYYIWDLEPDEYAKGEYVCLETEEEVIRQNKTCLFDEKVKSKNELRQFKTYKSPLVDTRGEMFGTVGIAKDVTDLQNIGRELEVILASIPFATMIVDEDDNIVSANQKFYDYFDLQSEQVLHIKYSDVCVKILGTTPKELESEHMTELRYHCGGQQYVFNAQQQSIHDIFGNHFGIFFLCFDITNEYELQNKLIYSANTDFLTGLYNRRYFYQVIGEEAFGEQISFVYFDLDDFKKVNDTYGHQSGDNALLLMAELLESAFPEQLIARLGGDEFVVAFIGTCELSQLVGQVEAFIEETGVIFRSTRNMEKLTVSAGIACNHSSEDIDAVLSCADKALYEAKAMGKARYMVYEDLR